MNTLCIVKHLAVRQSLVSPLIGGRSRIFSLVASLAILAVLPAPAAEVRFDVNDVSFLWPVAKTKADVDALISMDEKLPDGENIWPKKFFDQAMAEAQKAQINGIPIKFPDPAFTNPHTWKVVGIRVNPAALGATDELIVKFGEGPGLRLIVQPVTVSASGAVRVHDFAAHVVFNFLLNSPNEPLPLKPDKDLFKSVIADLKAIKALVESKVPTRGPLDVHPGFKANVPQFRTKLRELVMNHVAAKHLNAFSFMGLNELEPWIFFPMRKQPDGSFLSLAAQAGQMLIFRGGPPVVPAANGTISTAFLFSEDGDDVVQSKLDTKLDTQAVPNQPDLKVRDIADHIANPAFHHNLNTDCVSCHTESIRRHELGLPPSSANIVFPRPDGISGVAQSVLPKDSWNVRNFGWGLHLFTTHVFTPTVSQRAANEAAASADFINRKYLAQP